MINIQRFGGRGASSSVPKISKKMTRVYAPTYSKFSTSPDGKRLDGYKYNDYYIDIVEERRKYSMYGTQKFYRTTLKNGEKVGSYILREVKEYIEEDILNKKKK